MDTINPLEFCVNVTIPTVDSSGMTLYQCVGALAEAVQDFADQLNAAGLNKLSGDTLPLHTGGSKSISAQVETNAANAHSAIAQVNNLTFKFSDLQNDIDSKLAAYESIPSQVNRNSNNITSLTSKQAEHDALIKANTNQCDLNQQDNIKNKAEITKLNNLIFESESGTFPTSQSEIKMLYDSGVRLIIADQGSGKMKIGYIVAFVDNYEILEVG